MQGEIRPGYKQTELGVIPEDWDAAQLEDLADRLTVGFVGSMSHLFRKAGVPLLRGQDVRPGDLDFTGTKFISEETHKRWNKSALSAGDVVIVRVGYPGTAAVVPNHIKTANAASLLVLTPGREKLSSEFICQVLNSEAGKKQIDSYLVGGAQQVVNTRVMAHFVFASPPLAEQRAIATALADADALIAALEGMIAKKRDLKQAAMQHLLTGKTRLPGFSGEWEVKRLGEVAAIRNHKINTFGADAAAFCVELEQVGQNTGQIDGHSDARSRRSVKYLFQKGDVLFGRLRPYLRKFWWANRDGVCSTEIWPLIPIGDRLVSGFLFQTIQTDAFIEAANSSYGTHMPRSDWKALTKFEFNLPTDPNEQTAIAEVLSDMDADLAALEAQAAKARAVKQGVMQELLTGKVRLV
ncbi:restriction endonuclease subunit S [Sulfitobacter pontiacus]|uniref:restriction endonuclease subunit S n=1 Tax=Sulfitobacter pontiacus TaxID=60137 RepID=UPI002AC9A051|nr:restriction endonuclease subunit S [Sulfitobacter pontiacus]WPZ26323.1 restriction endonuclease subunit S [Sulfitobacter pontiacus]